jgi:hypothetical protein
VGGDTASGAEGDKDLVKHVALFYLFAIEQNPTPEVITVSPFDKFGHILSGIKSSRNLLHKLSSG